MRRIVVSALVLAAMVGVGGTVATGAVLTGRVTGIPRGAKARSVRVIDASTGEVIKDLQATTSGAYHLSVPAGVYILAADARGASGRQYGAVSAATRLGSSPKRIGLAAHTQAPPAGRSSPVARAASLDPGSVVTVKGVVIDAAPGAGINNLSLDGAVLFQLFDPCSNEGVRFVDQSDQVVAASEREQQLFDSGRAEGPFHYDPLAPQFQISGHGTASADGRVTVVLDLVDLSTGKVVDSQTAGGSVKDLDDVIGEVTDRFAQRDCGEPIASRCPVVGGERQACITTIVEIGAGGNVSQDIKSPGGSCSDPAGFSNSAATGVTWRYTWQRAILNATPGGAPGEWKLRGSYRIDAMCGLNNQHCSEAVAGSRGGDGSLAPWLGTGRPGRWTLKIPALASSYHPRCGASAIDDPNVLNSAIVSVTLHGKPGHPVRRSKIVKLHLSKTLECGIECEDSYRLNGRMLILGEW